MSPKGTTTFSDAFPNLPVRDSILAIADEDYFDWPVLPEAPDALNATASGNSVRLSWDVHGVEAVNTIVERRAAAGQWTRIATQPAANRSFNDTSAPTGVIRYRVRAANAKGESAYSNIARVQRGNP